MTHDHSAPLDLMPIHTSDQPNREPDRRLICALDVPTTGQARHLVEQTHEAVGFYKIGLQLFASDGMGLARELKADEIGRASCRERVSDVV
jgi:orotidine-5'-phosphate decarboxylase